MASTALLNFTKFSRILAQNLDLRKNLHEEGNPLNTDINGETERGIQKGTGPKLGEKLAKISSPAFPYFFLVF